MKLRTIARAALVGASLAAITALAALPFLEAPAAPVATWHFGPGRETAEPFEAVHRFDAMSLTIELPWPGYVYVASFDHRNGTVGYYPTEFLGSDHGAGDGPMHRFEEGRHELPGPWDGKQQSWFVPDVEEALSLCVVVSRERLDSLDECMQLLRQVGNRAFGNRAMGSYMPRAGRDKLIGMRKPPHPVLLAARDQADSIAPGSMVRWAESEGVFIKVLNVLPTAPRAGVKPPANPFLDQVQRAMEKGPRAPGQKVEPIPIRAPTPRK